MALPTTSRALTVACAALDSAELIPLKIWGREAINGLFAYELVLQTPDPAHGVSTIGANLDLNGLIGREISCTIALDGHGAFAPGGVGGAGSANLGAGTREINALITAARFLGQDNQQSLYQLTLSPWLHLATLTTDCKVFQNMTPVAVIEAVLADYPFVTDKRLIESYPLRDYCVQYNESDFTFVSRLCEEWGINFHFEHSAGVHRLVLSDHNGAFEPSQRDEAASAYHDIPYYPPGHKIDREYIHAFAPKKTLTSGAYASRDYDYTRPKAPMATSQRSPNPTGQNDHEVYLWRAGATRVGSTQSGAVSGSDYSQPQAGADKTNATDEQGQWLAHLRMQLLGQQGQRARGEGHIRGVVAGSTFALHLHPQKEANAEYIVLAADFLLENVGTQSEAHNGDAGTPTPVRALSHDSALNGEWRVHTAFEVQPTTVVLRPQATQTKPHTHGPETALVVGPDEDIANSNIFTDPLGRIKVQFPWDRYGAKNHNSSCWVRVSDAWAGNQLGAMHLPRIGEEVIVSFLGGDPDLPICTGRVYNQLNMPPWQLPEQQALSGFRSRELKPNMGNAAAGRSNHLILDDSDGQIQTQLKSDHDSSSLSLGHIVRVENNGGRQDQRGQGFELRTDGHGAIRAKDGLLITTEGRANAAAHTTDMGETTARLAQGQSQHQLQGELAQNHGAQEANDQDQVAQALEQQYHAIRGQGGQSEPGQFPELTQAHIVMASPAGLETTTPHTTHQHSGEHHAITSGGHTSLSIGQSLLVSAKQAVKLFAYKAGMKLISANQDIDIQALQANIHMLAKANIRIIADEVIISGTESVTINGGGSYTKWSAGGIESGTAGAWTAHASSHSMVGPANAPLPIPPLTPMPEPPPVGLRVQLDHLPDEPSGLMAGQPYRLFVNGQEDSQGVLDAAGQLWIKDHQPGHQYRVVLANGSVVDLPVTEVFARADQPKGVDQLLANKGVRADGQGMAQRQQQDQRNT